MRGRNQQRTGAALTEAREALIGYAIRYRESNPNTSTGALDKVYGYLPLPDLGSSRNNNSTDIDCYLKEGCEAYNFSGNGINVTVIGRFPWRTLGTGPIRDGNGECLWYAVSGSHQRNQPDPTRQMNWDTLSQLDVVVANGTAAMVSAITSAHDRPIAVIFSPGPPLAGQDRSISATDGVTECGGNYAVNNYLDPALASDLAGITNYLTGTTNKASGDTSVTNKSLSANGVINRRSDATMFAGNCPPNDTSPCAIVANDTGAAVTSELLFRTLRGSSYFRTDINAMLERMVGCLRDQFAAGGSLTLDANSTGLPASPADKTAGRIPTSTCYDDTQNPLGYFSHFKDQIFVAKPGTGSWDNTVAVDGVAQTSCSAALIFGSQRGAGQSRGTTAERNTPASYLEDPNLTGFIAVGTPSFAGPSLFSVINASRTNQHDIDRCLVAGTWTVSAGCHSAEQDIVRCVPAGAGASFTSVVSPALPGSFSQLSAYDPAIRTLTLGALGVRTSDGAPAYALYGCTWTPETHLTATGLRVYFRFEIANRGDGFVFAMIDGDRNSANVCGAARQHLGYSGNNDPDQSSNGLLPSIANNETAIVEYPKIGIEFDNTKATGTTTTSGNPLTAGRNDPDYTPPQDNDAHAAIVYWGGETAIATGTACNASNQCPYTGTCGTLGNCPAVRYCNTVNHKCYLRPEYDDNVHSFPLPPDASARPAPRNPPAVDPFPNPVYSPPPGLVTLDRLGSTTTSNRDFHVRVEVTRTYNGSPTDAKDRKGTYKVETWIVAEGVDTQQITAVKNTTRPMSELYSGLAATLSNDGIRYDQPRNACVLGVCPAGQSCASGTCYETGPPTIYDLPIGACDAQQKCSGPPLLKHNACISGACPAGSGQACGADNFCYDALYSCGSDNVCYAEAFRTMRLGFTNGQGTQDQVINISDFFTTWLP
ncbi:MAG: hypothetical protein Q7J42_13675 [Sulfuritalea sp.]|nr:hypothetical protein [Sulfuritalea sp.]